MNKLLKTIIAVMAGVDIVMTIITPIFVSLMFINFADLTEFKLNLVFGIGLISTLFRSIKIGLFNFIK